MKRLRPLLASVLAIALPLPAAAHPHVIAQLGTAPLIGQIASTPQLQNDVSRERRMFESAGTKLGLSPKEYAQFETRIARGELTYVTVPRHLDAMSWSSGGNVYVLHDVVVPAGTKGWEVDLQESDATVALFIPARCGNLSIVRRPRPHIAKVQAIRTVAAVPTPVPAPTAAPVESAPAFIPPQAPQTTPPPYESVAQSTPAHHFRWWPLLLIPVAAILFNGHGGSTNAPAITTSQVPPPPPVAPTPPPLVGCTPPPPAH